MITFENLQLVKGNDCATGYLLGYPCFEKNDN